METEHATHIDRLAEYQAGKLGRPVDEARRWAGRLTADEAAELVDLVDLIERKRAEHAADQAEADRITDELLAAERAELEPLGSAFARRVDLVADRLRAAPADQDETGPRPLRSIVAAKRKRKPKGTDGQDTGPAKAA